MTDGRHIDRTASMAPASDPRRLAKDHQARAREDHPKQIGPYKVLEVLGEGGMGTVYLAEQEKPIHRRVALKIIKLGMDTKSVIARFEAEREALAVMDHPNVAKVFDAGATEQGRPYFVMEYVKGIPITDYCDRHRLSTEERLRLFMDVCHAVQHAHQKGIIHRDIKPSNVLVTVQDDRPIVKVIDFGVAKATQHRLTEQTVFTEHGQLIGTPGYMSPEQAEMTALDIDTRTDIYSLGVLLYELLVGMRPFDDDLLQRAAIGEIQRIIRESDPPKPSTRLSGLLSEPPASAGADSPDSAEQRTSARAKAHGSLAEIARARHTEPKTLARQIRGDLDWIVMKCLEKDRTRRYDTANALAIELQRYLKNEPVLAGPPRASYRVRKFVQRHRNAIAFITVAFVVITSGIVVASYGLGRAVLERHRAQQAVAALGASNIMMMFLDVPELAAEEVKEVGQQQTVFLREFTNRFVDSSQSSLRIIGARAAMFVDPAAFWRSVAAGPLWQQGEWLELLRADWPDYSAILEELKGKALSGSAKEKYAAFCLLGQLFERIADRSAAINLCRSVVSSEKDPGVVMAAWWAARNLGEELTIPSSEHVYVDNLTGMTFVAIQPTDSFRRGADNNDPDRYVDEDRPESSVRIRRVFVSVTELTAAAFLRIADESATDPLITNPILSLHEYAKAKVLNRFPDNCAVGDISLEMAQALCKFLNKKVAGTSRARVYRLPTEDEWEYACRAGDETRRFCFGNNTDYLRYFARSDGAQSDSHVVAEFMPNAFGLFDLHGGLWELTDSVYDGPSPMGAVGHLWVSKGGAWYSPAVRTRCSQRNYREADSFDYYTGVRLVLEFTH
jgi:serine/threonine protein kinase/formylglycine-generating enzyme required for sulfatase activity